MLVPADRVRRDESMAAVEKWTVHRNTLRPLVLVLYARRMQVTFSARLIAPVGLTLGGVRERNK